MSDPFLGDDEPAAANLAASAARYRMAVERLERDNRRLRATLGLYGIDPDGNYGGSPAHRALLALQAVIAAGILLDERYAEAWPWLRQAIAVTGPLVALRATHGPPLPHLLGADEPWPPTAQRPSEGVAPSEDLFGDDPAELDRIESDLHTGNGPMMAETRAEVVGQIIDLLPGDVDVEGIALVAVRAAWPRAGAAAIRDTATVVEVVHIPPFSAEARRVIARWMRHTADRRLARKAS